MQAHINLMCACIKRLTATSLPKTNVQDKDMHVQEYARIVNFRNESARVKQQRASRCEYQH